MNNVIITGRLAKDPELKTTNTGKQICTFRIAYQKHAGSDQVKFYTVRAWDKVAQNVCKYKRKGDQVHVLGALDSYDQQLQDGSTRQFVYINASMVEFGLPAAQNAQQPAPAPAQAQSYAPAPPPPPPANVAVDYYGEDDLPF